MEARTCLQTRRSIRKFTDKQVTKEEITEMIRLAQYAPSWKNTQTPGYIAVQNKELILKIAEEATAGFDWNKGIISGAPTLMVVTTEDGISGYEQDGTPTTTKGSHWQSFDAGLATQTMCLAAHAMGLATVIMGIFEEAKVKEILDIPDGKSVSALVALGHSAQWISAKPRKKTEEVLTFAE